MVFLFNFTDFLCYDGVKVLLKLTNLIKNPAGVPRETKHHKCYVLVSDKGLDTF